MVRRGTLVAVLVATVLIGMGLFFAFVPFKNPFFVWFPNPGGNPNPGISESFGQFGPAYFQSLDSLGIMVGWPDKAGTVDQPLWLVVVKYPKGQHWSQSYEGGSKHNGKEWDLSYSLTLKENATGKEYLAKHAASSADGTEKFRFHGKDYPVKNGRVFLLDLTGAEPVVEQLPFDPADFFQRPKNPADPRPELNQALEQLKSKSPRCLEFVGKQW